MEDALVEFVAHASRRTPKVKLSHSVTDVTPGEVILDIPSKLLLHPSSLATGKRLTCLPLKKHEQGKLPRPHMSTHQIVACTLSLWRAAGKPQCDLSPFLASLPQAFPTSPLLWQIRWNDEDQRLFSLLTYTAKSRAAKVLQRFKQDWQHVEDASRNTPSFLQEIWLSLAQTSLIPRLSEEEFLWGWLCTNSRCVYMDLNYLDHADNFTLAPLLDMANHTAIPWLECSVRYSSTRNLELLAPSQSRPENAGRVGLRKGDEVCITYGAHANSTLLAEYGFVLPRTLFPEETDWKGNRYCDICLDQEIEKAVNDQGRLGAWKRDLLIRDEYWSALRLLCLEVNYGSKRLRTIDGSSISCRDAERIWRLATNGVNQRISKANEDAVHSELIRLSNEILQRHTYLLQQLDAMPSTDSSHCVRQILEEETEIAKLVRASVESGDEW